MKTTNAIFRYNLNDSVRVYRERDYSIFLNSSYLEVLKILYKLFRYLPLGLKPRSTLSERFPTRLGSTQKNKITAVALSLFLSSL